MGLGRLEGYEKHAAGVSAAQVESLGCASELACCREQERVPGVHGACLQAIRVSLWLCMAAWA